MSETDHTSIDGCACTRRPPPASAPASSGATYTGSSVSCDESAQLEPPKASVHAPAGRSASAASTFHPDGKRISWRGECAVSTTPQRWSSESIASSERSVSRASGTLGRRPGSRESRASCSSVKRPSSTTR